jgi:N-methylhydantoinase A
VHAYGVARILRSPAVLAPARAGVASALGFLVAPIASEAVRAYVTRLDRIDWAHLRASLAEMEAKGRAFLASAGVAERDIVVSRTADMQYVGQMHDISVPLPPGELAEADAPRLREAFFTRYRDLFHRTAELTVEALNWRVTVSAAPPPLDLVLRKPAGGTARKGQRQAYFPEADGYVETPVHDRYALVAGSVLQGPAIVEERESTLVVGPGARVSVDEFGTLVVEPPAASAQEAA